MYEDAITNIQNIQYGGDNFKHQLEDMKQSVIEDRFTDDGLYSKKTTGSIALALALQTMDTGISTDSELSENVKQEKLRILKEVLTVSEQDWERIGEEKGKQIRLQASKNIKYPGQTSAPYINSCEWWFKNGNDMKQRIIDWVEKTKNNNSDEELTILYDWKEFKDQTPGQRGAYTSQSYPQFKNSVSFHTFTAGI